MQPKSLAQRSFQELLAWTLKLLNLLNVGTPKGMNNKTANLVSWRIGKSQFRNQTQTSWNNQRNETQHLGYDFT